MKLLTDEIRKSLPSLYSSEEDPDPIARVKFLAPWTDWTWYAVEFDGEDLFWGLVCGFERECGYFSLSWQCGYFRLSELESVRGPAELTVERDLYFNPTPLSQLKT